MKIIDLQEGSKIKFGKYQVETEEPEVIKWEIAGKDLYGNGGVTFITEQIIDLRAFDGKEPNNPDGNRKNHGNNKYSVSNIDQWLNSKEQDWYKPQHDYDMPPDNTNTTYNTGYNTRPGFLYNFSHDEINNIIPSIIRIGLNVITDGGSYEDITRKVFLPSFSELGLEENNRIKENEKFFNFNSNTDRKSIRTEQCFNNSLNTNNLGDISNCCYYWTRTPYWDYSYSVIAIDSIGGINKGKFPLYGYLGIRPCLTLKPNLNIKLDSDGYYTILPQSKYCLYRKRR